MLWELRLWRAAIPLLELRLFEPPSPEGALKKISEQTIPSELPEKK